MTLPRLTSALRAFSTVTSSFDDDPRSQKDLGDLERKRRLQSDRQKESEFTWKQLCAAVKAGGAGSGRGHAADKELKSLSRAARTIGMFRQST